MEYHPNEFSSLKIYKNSNSDSIVNFYSEILTGKVVLWCFSTSETSEKNPQFNFSSQDLSIEHNFFK